MLSDLFTSLPNIFEESENALAICGDALEVLRNLPDGAINLIFADPPYNIGKDFGNGSEIKIINQYIEWCYAWIQECYRVLHPQGTFYFMAATQYMPYLDMFVSKQYHVLSRLIWVYDSSGVQSKRHFGSLYEPIIMIVKDPKKYTFNTEAIAVEAKTGAQRKLIDYRKSPPRPYNAKKIPGNVWNFPRVRYRMDEYENHPSQKPVGLLERIILASSNAGDIVLDPFGGTFTTGAVAIKLRRFAIGIDINTDYFKIGLRRMKLCDDYEGEKLERDLSRKTKNKSKKDHSSQP